MRLCDIQPPDYETSAFRIWYHIESCTSSTAYDPTGPDADEISYVEPPNVDMVKEITDAMSPRRSFSTNDGPCGGR